jgi:DNA-binding phage protein
MSDGKLKIIEYLWEGKSKGGIMALTRSFRNTILERAEKDTAFRRQMLIEAVNELLAGDLNAGKAILRDYINATITFEGLAKKTKISSKSLHRMLGPHGNPRADNILEIIRVLQSHERITLKVKASLRAA